MAETTNLLQQAGSGSLDLSELTALLGTGTPNINQPQTPQIETTPIRPDVPSSQPEPTTPVEATTSPGALDLSDLIGSIGQSPQQGLPVEQTLPLSPEMQAASEQPSFFRDVVLQTPLEAAGELARGTLLGITEMSDLLAKGIRSSAAIAPLFALTDKITGTKQADLPTLTKIVQDQLPAESKEFGNRVVREVGKVIPTALLTGGGIARAAQSGTKLPGVIQTMVDDFVRMGPKKFAQLEAAMSIAGAGGGEAAVETKNFLGLDSVPDWAAQLGGGLVATIGAANLSNLSTAVKARFSSRPTIQAKRVEEKIGQALTRQAPTKGPLFDNLAREAGELQEAIPGFSLGLAETTREPGLIKFSDKIIGQSPDIAQQAQARVKNNAEAITSALNSAKSRANIGDIEAIGSKIRSNVSSIQEAVAEQIKKEQQPVLGLQQQVAGLGSAEPSLTLRQAARDAEFSLNSLANEMFGGVSDTLGDQPLFSLKRSVIKAVRGTDKQAGKFRRQIGDTAQRSPLISAIREAAGRKNQSASFADMRSIIIEANDEIKTLSRKVDLGQADPLDTQTLQQLRNVRKSAQFELDRLGSGKLASQFPGAAQAFNKARSTFAEVAQPVRSKFFKQLVAKDTAGQQTISDSVAFGNKLLGDTERTKNYIDVMSGFATKGRDDLSRFNNPNALKALSDFAKRDFITSVTKNGEVDTRLMATWIKNHPGVKQIPELSKQLTTVKTAQEMVDSLTKQKGALLHTDESKILQNFMKGASPDVVMEEVLSSSNPAKGINTILQAIRRGGVTGSGAPEAMQGLRKAVWDHMERRVSTPVTGLEEFPLLNAQAMRSFLDEYKGVLPQIYDAATLKNLDVIQRASFRAQREARSFTQAAGSPKLEKEVEQMSGFLGTIFNRIKRGKSNLSPDLPFTVEAATMRRTLNSFSEREHAALLHAAQKAIFDPDAASLMKQGAQNANSQAFKARLATYAVNHSNAITALQEKQQ